MTDTKPTTDSLPAREHVDLPLKAIKPHPRNVRHEVAVDQDLRDLADSITAIGVEQAVTVVPAPTKGKTQAYYLVAGHRRHAASKLAGLKDIPAVVRRDLPSEADQVRFMWIENHHRKDLSPIEEGDGLQALMDLEGLNQTELAKSVGRSRKVVRDRLKIAALPESARLRVTSAQLTVEDAVKLAEFNDDPDTQRVLEAALTRGQWDFQHTYRQLKDERQRQAARAKTIRELTKAGITFVEDEPDEWMDIDDLVPWDVVNETTDPADDEAAFEQNRKDHESCPGHVAFLPTYREDPTWLCSRPDLHETSSDAGPEPEAGDVTRAMKKKSPGPSPEDLQLERDTEELRSAAKVRRAYLGTLVRADDNESMALEAMRDKFERRLTHVAHADDRRALAGVLYDFPDAISDEDLPEQLRGTLRTLSLPALVILHELDLSRDQYLETPGEHNWRGEWSPTKNWRAELVRLGYEWSPIERRLQGLDEDQPREVAEHVETSCSDEEA